VVSRGKVGGGALHGVVGAQLGVAVDGLLPAQRALIRGEQRLKDALPTKGLLATLDRRRLPIEALTQHAQQPRRRSDSSVALVKPSPRESRQGLYRRQRRREGRRAGRKVQAGRFTRAGRESSNRKARRIRMHR
jgi:hypothetical protein